MTDEQFVATIGNIARAGGQLYFSAWATGEENVYALLNMLPRMFEGNGRTAKEALENLIAKARLRDMDLSAFVR